MVVLYPGVNLLIRQVTVTIFRDGKGFNTCEPDLTSVSPHHGRSPAPVLFRPDRDRRAFPEIPATETGANPAAPAGMRHPGLTMS